MSSIKIKDVELRECPFCGSEAFMFEYIDIEQYTVVCQHPECECNARLPYCNTKEDAQRQWNRRTEDGLERGK